MFHKESMHLVSSSDSALEVKKYFTLIFTSYNMVIILQISTLKKLSSLKRGVRAINHTYKTAQIIFVKIFDRYCVFTLSSFEYSPIK